MRGIRELRRLRPLLVIAALMLFTAALAGCSADEDVSTPATSNEVAAEETTVDNGVSAASSSIDGQAVIEGACTQCHTVARIYLQSDATDWSAVIDRMDEQHTLMFESNLTDGAGLTPERRAAIIEFMKTRTKSEGELVVREKCVTCHALTNITQQAQGADWANIVDRMVQQHDASLTVEEQQAAVNFLQGQ